MGEIHMPLQLVVDSLDSVPEALRDQYVEANGKFRLNVDGYEDPSGLKSALQKERDAAKALEKQVKAWSALGKSPEDIQELLKAQEDREDKELVDRKEFDKLFEKRIERLKSDYEKRLADAVAAAEAAQQRAQSFQGRVLDESIRAAAAKAGIHPHAIDDALLRARAIFTLGDDGNAVQLGEDGRPVLGKDGKSPFTPLEWLEGMREKAPHWYPASASGGGAGESGHRAGAMSPKSLTEAKTPEERRAVLKARFEAAGV